MEWAVIVLCTSLLTGIGISHYIYRNDPRSTPEDYIYVSVLWWLFLPIATYKSFMDHPVGGGDEVEEYEDDSEDPTEVEEGGEEADR